MKIYHVDHVQIKNLIYNRYALIESKSFNESFGSSSTVIIKKNYMTDRPTSLKVIHILLQIDNLSYCNNNSNMKSRAIK